MAGKASTFWPNGMKPSIGDTVLGKVIGRGGRGIFTWFACPDCGLERWVSKHQATKMCMSCAAVRRKLTGKRNPRWNGGVRKADGYNYISVAENHPLVVMASRVFVHNRYRYNIAEHRLVMAEWLRRPLEKWELVHHRNGVRDDNRIENLELLKHKVEHLPSMNVQRVVSELQMRVTLLEAENTALRSLLEGGQDGVSHDTEYMAP